MLYGVHLWLCLLITVAASRPGDMSSFFLKAPKSVPRAGRAAPGHYDGFFVKTSKSVPRIGRRNGLQNTDPGELQKIDFYHTTPLNFDDNYYASNKDDFYTNQQFNKEFENHLWNAFQDDDILNDYKNQIEQMKKIYGDSQHVLDDYFKGTNEVIEGNTDVLKDNRDNTYYIERP